MKKKLCNYIYYAGLIVLLIFFYSCGSCSKDNDNKEEVFYIEGTIGEEEIKEAIEFVPEPNPFPPTITHENIVVATVILSASLVQRSDIVQRSDFYKLNNSTSTYDKIETLDENWKFKISIPINKVANIVIGFIETESDINAEFKMIESEANSLYVLGRLKSSRATGLESNIGGGSNFKDKTITLASFSFNNGHFETDLSNYIDTDGDGVSDADDEDYDGDGMTDIEESNKIIVDGEENNDELNLAVGIEKSFEIKLSKESIGSFSTSNNTPVFCTFSDNDNYTATLTCKPEEVDIGTQHIKLSYKNVETQELISELDVILIIRNYEHKIYTGSESTCFIFDGDGSNNLKCWGDNSNGELGLGDTNNRGDNPDEMGGNLPFVDLGTGEEATKVGIGSGLICALLTDGRIKCWGRNNAGQLGQFGEDGLLESSSIGDEVGEMGDYLPFVDVGNNSLKAVDIVAGESHVCALFDDSSIRCWGGGFNGELGLGEVSILHKSKYIDKNELKVNIGTNTTPIALSSNAGNYTCVITSDGGSVKCWGKNDMGQLGLGDTKNRGDEDGEMGDNLPAIDFGSDLGVVSLATGLANSCAIFENGKVKCWGRNDVGQLGLGDTNNRGDEANEMGENLPYVELGKNRIAYMISTGIDQTCVLLDNLSIKCWGVMDHVGKEPLGNSLGEMGDELAQITFEDYRPIEISSESGHICVRFTNNKIKCWGANYFGQLGLGDATLRDNLSVEAIDSLPFIDLGF